MHGSVWCMRLYTCCCSLKAHCCWTFWNGYNILFWAISNCLIYADNVIHEKNALIDECYTSGNSSSLPALIRFMAASLSPQEFSLSPLDAIGEIERKSSHFWRMCVCLKREREQMSERERVWKWKKKLSSFFPFLKMSWIKQIVYSTP